MTAKLFQILFIVCFLFVNIGFGQEKEDINEPPVSIEKFKADTLQAIKELRGELEKLRQEKESLEKKVASLEQQVQIAQATANTAIAKGDNAQATANAAVARADNAQATANTAIAKGDNAQATANAAVAKADAAQATANDINTRTSGIRNEGGNLVVRVGPYAWALQSDGNFVLYRSSNWSARWATGTNGW